jgi:hypothetical protein
MAVAESCFLAIFEMMDVDDKARDEVSFGPYGRRIHNMVMGCGEDIGSGHTAKVLIDKKVWTRMAPKVRELCLFLDIGIIEEIQCAQTRYLLRGSIRDVIPYKDFKFLLGKVNIGFEPGGWSPFPDSMCLDDEVLERLDTIAQRVLWVYDDFNCFFFGVLRNYVFGLDRRGRLSSRNRSLRALALTSVIDACGGEKEWLGPVKVASLGLPASISDEIVSRPFRPCAIYTNFLSTKCYVE